MTLTRYQIRNEYGLGDKQLYQSTDKEDPEALFEGSSMAGLVGVLRQLGDLAEFAGEVFHCLHEELMTTASRGHGLAMRLQQLETELPSVEIPVLSQTDHSTFFYEPGLEWHSTLQTEENLISRRKLPHCIMDSYEECRGLPELDLLDKFDVVGAGSCLKRYSDPSLLKTSAVVKLSEDERPKKKVSHTTSRERLEDSHAKLHQLFLLEHVENGVTNTEFHVKLKRRHPINSSSGTSYMEKFLKNSLMPCCERVHGTLYQSSLAMETEVTTCNVREDLSIPSLFYQSSSVNLFGKENNDTDAPASTDSEAKVVESDDKTGGNHAFPIFGQTEMTQTEVLAQYSNVLQSEEGESSMLKLTEVPLDASEDGAKVLPKGYVEETESEMSLTALVEDQFSSITNQEMEIESHSLLIQNQNITTLDNSEDLSLDINSQDGSPINTEHSGHISAFEISSESGALMSDTPRDLHTGTKNLSASSWQEDALDNSDLADISSDYGQEDPQRDGSSELEVSIPDNETSLNDKAGETVPQVECFSPEYCIQTHDQVQESLSETGSENPIAAAAAAESLPPQDVILDVHGSPSDEALTCNEGPEIAPPLPPLPPTQWWLGKLVTVEAMSTSAQTTLNKPSKETEEQSPSEPFSSVSLLTAEATPEALEWFSQNLREHTNPNLAKLEEEPHQQDNSSYEQNEKFEKLPRDKDSLVIGIDRSMLRKVSERNKTQVGARVEETDSLLEIIRSKSFNLRPPDASVRHNFQVAVPITNLKVAAILEKANTLRHAMAGSDDDHDSDSWSE